MKLLPRNRELLIESAQKYLRGDTIRPGIRFIVRSTLLTILMPTILHAQSTPQRPKLTVPFPAIALVDPLSPEYAKNFRIGRFGTFQFASLLSGFGAVQSQSQSGDRVARADIGNGLIFLQKDHGPIQFFLMAGAYNFPIIGVPLLSTGRTISDFFGPLPIAYLKVEPKENFSILIGKMPSIIGPENTFDFQNIDIQRGLLWNQENDVDRGIQVNYARKKFSTSVTWNDGYYSNRYNWLNGAFIYTFSPSNSLETDIGGNFGRTTYSSVATPLLQSNSDIYVLTYTHTAARWLLQSYLQYDRVPADSRIDVARSAATFGGTVLAKYSLSPHFSIGARAEDLGSTGNPQNGSVNLLYGPGSRALSATVTPTYVGGIFFSRAEFSLTHAANITSGAAFGPAGNASTQARGVIELGLIF